METSADITPLKSTANVTDDREALPKFWIAAYTRPKSERKAASQLSANLGIDTYVPVQTVTKQWSDRKKKIDIVVIPMVIFAEVSSPSHLLSIKKHPLILKILTMPGQREAARIPYSQISQLRFMLDRSAAPVEFIPHSFNVSDPIRVVRGQLAGLTGTVDRTPDGHTYIIISIDLLGGAKAEVSQTDIELIK